MELTQNKNKVVFMDEVRQQPVALRQFVEQGFGEEDLQSALNEMMRQRKHPHIVLTGMGSSLYACYITMKLLQSRGILASAVESYELQMMDTAFFTEDTIVVAVSQSGESPEVVELLEKLPAGIPVIGVSNYPNSRLHRMAEWNCGVYAGTEYLTSTKTYTNTVAAMLLLAYRIAGGKQEELDELRTKMLQCADEMDEMIADTKTGSAIAAFLSDIRFLICVASGYSYTTACHSEIVAEEAGKFDASRFTPAQFIHGPIELIQPGFGVLIYDMDRKYSAKCDDVRENVLQYGGKVLLITNRKDVEARENQLVVEVDHEDPVTGTLLEVIPLELGIDSLCNSRGVAAGQLSRVVKRMAL